MTKTKSFLRVVWAALLLVLLVCAGGCGEQTKPEERIIYGALTEPYSLHPLVGVDAASTEAQSLIYNALTRVNGAKRLEGDLAEAWDISADGRVYTFSLRRGVLWHDGKPFTAEDVVYTYEAARDPQNAYLDAAELQNIDAVRAADAHTVVITLKRADAVFLARTAGLFLLPKHRADTKENIRRSKAAGYPIGTGPYKFAEWQKAQYLRLTANEAYYRGAPQVKTFFYKVVPDANVLAMQLRRGEIDLCHLDAAAADTLKEDAAIRITDAPAQAYTYISLNHERQIFREAAVRRAMAMAFDRQSVIDAILGGQGFLAAADLPPSSWGSDPALRPLGYDVQAARTELDAAGWLLGADGIRAKDGERLAFQLLLSNRSKRLSDTALAFQQDMKAVGIAVELVPMDFTTMRQKHLIKGDYDACLISQRLPIDPGMRRQSWGSGEQGNFTKYSNTEIDRLFEAAETMTDAPERQAAYRRVQQILRSEQPQLFLWYPSVTLGVRSNAEGIAAAAVGGKDNLFWNVETWKKR